MEIASFSYAEDMKQGFDLLHIDPTKDPHVSGTVDLDIVLERTVQLIETAERDRERLGIPSLGYEVGTEETNGGLTSIEAFETFSRRLTEQLAERGLPRPLFIVGQTGTLTRLTENVGQYNTAEAIKLTETANRYGMGLKEHNGDYLSNAILLEHPAMTLDAMNVAPEFGVCETLANLDLCALEAKFISEGRSAVRQKMTEYAVKGERWRKWVMGATATAPVEEIFKDEALSEQILHICGHYTLEEPEVKSQLAVLYANVAKLGLDGKEYVKKRIKDSVDRYASCFNMYGLTSKLLGR